MQDDQASGPGTGLQDDFDAQNSGSATATAAPGVDAVSGAGAIAPNATAGTTAPAEPPEIEMPPEWGRSGPPPRPQQVRDEIEDKTKQAESARERSQQLTEQEKKVDADVDVASRLLASRQQDHQELADRLQALDARRAELVEDAGRKEPDINRASQEVDALKRQLGIRVPSDTDLMPSDGAPAPTPVTPETDAAKIAVLQGKLAEAETKLQQEIAARDSSADGELARIRAERDALAPQLARADDAMKEQQSSVGALKERADALEKGATDSLDQARGLETEVKNLADALPDYEQIWTRWAAEHPDQATVTDRGAVEVKVPPRETAMAYAQGRREEAGRLEQQASDADKASADAANGAQSRLDLAQRNDEEVSGINQRLASSDARATSLQSQANDADQRADKLAADADRMVAESKQLRATGRAEAADTMDERARAMTEESIKVKFRADDLQKQATSITDSTASERSRADALSQEATKLRDDAATLSTQSTTLQQQATTLREDATTRDHIAAEVEDRLQSGVAFKFQLVDDRMGESITLDVPAGPPPYTAPADGAPTADAGDPAAAAPTAATADVDAVAGTADPVAGGDVTMADDVTGATALADASAPADAPAAADEWAGVSAADATTDMTTDAPPADATVAVADPVPAVADPVPAAAEAFAEPDASGGFDSGATDFAAPDPSHVITTDSTDGLEA